MAARVGTIHPSLVNPSDQVTSRPWVVAITPVDGTAATTVTVDLMVNANFNANDGDAFSVTPMDVNSFGNSLVGPVFTGTVAPTPPPPPPPPTAVPATPTVLGVSFV